MTSPAPRAAVRREELRLAREQARRARGRRWRAVTLTGALLTGAVVAGTAVIAAERSSSDQVEAASLRSGPLRDLPEAEAVREAVAGRSGGAAAGSDQGSDDVTPVETAEPAQEVVADSTGSDSTGADSTGAAAPETTLDAPSGADASVDTPAEGPLAGAAPADAAPDAVEVPDAAAIEADAGAELVVVADSSPDLDTSPSTAATADGPGDLTPAVAQPSTGAAAQAPDLATSLQRATIEQLSAELAAALTPLDPVLGDAERLRVATAADAAADLLRTWPDAVVDPERLARSDRASAVADGAAAALLRLPERELPTAADVEAVAQLLRDAVAGLPQIVVTDGLTTIDGIVVANKTFALPSTYDPGLQPELVAAFDAMRSAAAADGITLFIKSGYRTFIDQRITYDGYADRHGAEVADRFSARPGHSEHQTGLSIDVNSTSPSFAGTPEALWVAAHAHEFGFVVRFPEGKEAITGYTYEPWHLRYLGTDLATTLVQQGLTLEEHLGVTSRY